MESVGSSGVVGTAGRYPLSSETRSRSADLVLAGEPLPLAGTLRVYTCGITPYDVTHLGHAATFAWADLLAGLARWVEVAPQTARNVTDIDDVLTAAAGRRARPYDEYALTQEFLFDRDMADLDIARPDLTPHARAHVRHVIQLAEGLVRMGRAYRVDDHVFFTAPEDLDRGGLTEAEAVSRFAEFGDAMADGRRAPWDVPLWRASPEDHPAWPSPWGWGRPAWHVECAAMALSVLGSSIDVLVGGADLAFPHHAYQAAMVEAVTGVRPFARRQLHVGTVGYDGAKMAKSTGNLVLIRDLLEQAPAGAVRLLLLNRPWADAWDYHPDALDASAALLDDLHAAAGRPAAGDTGRDRILAALLCNLDVPTAIAIALDQGGLAARALVDLLKL